MSLGSSIGNFNPDEAAVFLKGFASVLSPHDLVLVGLDSCQDKDKVYHAYNDRYGTTHEFIRNGLKHANRLMEKDVFKLDDWEVIGEYDVMTNRHQAFYRAKRELQLHDFSFAAGEKVRIEESYKHSLAQSDRLWEGAGLRKGAVWGDSTDQYRKQSSYILSHPRGYCSSMFQCLLLKHSGFIFPILHVNYRFHLPKHIVLALEQ